MKTLAVLGLVLISGSFLSGNLSAQVFIPDSLFSGHNYYVGIGVGQGQLNIENAHSIYGRTTVLPRLSIETGFLYKGAPKHALSLSLRLTYQSLYLHSPVSTSGYNDKLSFLDAQLRPLMHIGGKRFMVFLGPAIRLPLTSGFKIHALDADTEYHWRKFDHLIEANKVNVALELGTKIKFGTTQIGFIYTGTNADFLTTSRSHGPYSLNAASYNTIEIMLYLPLEL